MSQLLIALIGWKVQLVKAADREGKNTNSLAHGPVQISYMFSVRVGGGDGVTRCEQKVGGQWSGRHGGSGTSGCRSCPPGP